ncbi:MAG TPA: alpha-glucan family phosphorylase [Ilumatobacteraceae bacterium]|nr:alpha-glucan family phosphorylase [Ilumatobacteraceae bacterium]
MRAVRQFNVVPAIPTRLAALASLANNLHWTWDRETKALFGTLDPELWESSGRDPLRLIAGITASRWDELAADPEIAALTNAAAERLDQAMTEPRWFQGRADTPLQQVAYFSPEFGLTETLPQYSGGLGVLAGDHLKAASDLGVPLVAIGLLYAEGYFRQRLNADGYQEERFPRLDNHGLALTPTGVQVSVDMADEIARLNVWQVSVGRIKLYLLDAAVESNSPEVAAITNRLYGGDIEHRLRQEIVLGIGGVRALRALGLYPQVFHTNEGHAGFLSLERIREAVEKGLSFAEAIEVVRAGGVFTTHTPVPAGIDRFPHDLMQKYFYEFAASLGVDFGELMAVGRRPDEPDDDRFNMAVMGLRLAGRSNGVAQLHGAVSREMFQGMWPDVSVEEVPIGAITNGVHAHTWVSTGVANLLSDSVGPVWDGADEASWAGVAKLSPADIWATRAKGRANLVSFVRSKFGESLLDPQALTIGFARRFATYKRATLLLSQPDRLRRMLLDSKRPVQFVFAGKAHPADQPGKDMIRQIELFARQLDGGSRVVFLQDYDMAVARTMLHGCDVWLNNPRRPLEACGTSGMKAALNGVLNCSILDGWWNECYDGTNGWAVASADDDPDLARRDQREATSLFGLLEREIIPLFYDRDANGIPLQWIDKMKQNWRTLGPFVTAARMVRQYTSQLYEPAATSGGTMLADDAARGKALAHWKQRINKRWADVKVVEVDIDTTPANEGDERTVRARVELGGLATTEVMVQALHGPTDSAGSFISTPAAFTLRLVDDGAFEGTYIVGEAGPYGVTVRTIPHNGDLIDPMEMGLVAWAV